MIDMHNHILIKADDGPQNKAEAIQLLRQAKDEGVTGIIATPHYTSTYNNTFDKVKLKVKELCKLKKVEALGLDIYPGQEVRISDYVLDDLKSGKVRGLNDSNYLLIEFPPNEVPEYTKPLFKALQKEGYTPIIAHPERNSAIMKDMNHLYEFVSEGALSQITSASLGGYFGKGLQLASIEMIRSNLTHFIASDAHQYDYRPFILNGLFEETGLKPIHHTIKALIDNADAIVSNRSINRNTPNLPTYSKELKAYLF